MWLTTTFWIVQNFFCHISLLSGLNNPLDFGLFHTGYFTNKPDFWQYFDLFFSKSPWLSDRQWYNHIAFVVLTAKVGRREDEWGRAIQLRGLRETLFGRERTKPVVRLQRHPLIDSIFFWSPRISASLAGRNLYLVTSCHHEVQPLFLHYSVVNLRNHTWGKWGCQGK